MSFIKLLFVLSLMVVVFLFGLTNLTELLKTWIGDESFSLSLPTALTPITLFIKEKAFSWSNSQTPDDDDDDNNNNNNNNNHVINECIVLPLGYTPKSTDNKITFTKPFSSDNPAPDLVLIAQQLNIVKENVEQKYKAWCSHKDSFYSIESCFNPRCGGVMWIGHDGDLWIWALDPGTEKVVKLSDRTVKIKSVSLKPILLEVETILTEDEAKQLIETAESRLHRSTLHGTNGEAVSQTRTSSTAWVFPSENKAAFHQDLLLSELLGLPYMMVQDSGAFQVIRYYPGEHYHIHHDAFESDNEKKEIGFACGRNRFITVLYYLNEVESGGETNFPSVGQNDTVIQNYQCQQGYNLVPKKLNAAIFYNLDPSDIMGGKRDMWAYHAGCPVKTGVKWASNRWIHNKMRPHDQLKSTECHQGTNIPYGWDYRYPILMNHETKQEL